MKKYRVRENSIIDHARYIFAGALFWVIIGIVTVTTYGV